MPSKTSSNLKLIGISVAIATMSGLIWGCSASVSTSNTASVTDPSFLAYHRGEQAYDYGDYEGAKRNFEEFVNNYADESLHPIALFYLGRSYEQLKEFNKAKDIYNQVIEKYQGDFWAQSAERRIRNMN